MISPARAVVGALGLALLAVESRFRLRGRYWAWRMQTAYGPARPSRARLAADLLEFGAWRMRMSRFR